MLKTDPIGYIPTLAGPNNITGDYGALGITWLTNFVHDYWPLLLLGFELHLSDEKPEYSTSVFYNMLDLCREWLP